MSRFLYPIRRLKVMPWIKYWMIKRTAGILSEVMENLTSPITLTNALKRRFKIFEIGGNSIQDGVPTPESPIPIQNVSGTVDVKVENKNIFNNNDTFINAYLTATGSQVSNLQNALYPFKKINSNSKVSLSTNTKIYGFALYEFDINKNFIQRQQNVSPQLLQSATFTISSNCEYIRYGINYNQSDTMTQQLIETLDIQVEIGEPTSYVPHEEQTVTLQLPEGMEMCKIGDYEDKFDKQENKWYKYKMIGKRQVVSTDNFTILGLDATQGFIQMSNFYGKRNTSEGGNMLCNYLSKAGLSGNDDNSMKVGFAVTDTNDVIRFRLNTGELSLADTRTWLNEHKLIFYYILKTPAYEEITDETLIQQLDSLAELYSYKGTTHISSDNTPSPIFKIQYVKEE